LDIQPSEEELNKLPEALSHLANLISTDIAPDEPALKKILSEVGLNGKGWALERLELWCTILVRARSDLSNSEKDSIMADLEAQGMGKIRQGHAFFAYDKVKPKPISVYPEFVDLGLLDPGEGADRTLEVTQGTVKKVFSSKSLKVNLINTSSGKTLIKVAVSGGNAGESLNGEVILRGDRGELKVPVTVRWKTRQEEPPLLSWCPDCGPAHMHKKSLFYNKYTKRYECFRCKHEFPYPDKRVTQYNDTHP